MSTPLTPQLSNETKARIENDAEAYTKQVRNTIGQALPIDYGIVNSVYQDAATAEALKAKGLVEALEKICDWFDNGCHIDDDAGIMIIEAQQLIKLYNQTV